MSEFDAIAEHFDRFRALPPGVPAAIRTAIWEAVPHALKPCLLDLGAGTGRIGETFVTAGDAYVAVDRSARMLAQFASKAATQGGPPPALVQADGASLPFPESAFDAVLIVQVLSGIPRWRRLLTEAQRVLRTGGALVLGRALLPPDGIDARMRVELSRILAGMGIDTGRPGALRDEARNWLASGVCGFTEVVVARWEATRSPRDFLARHATGARFAALPREARDKALGQLSDWAVAVYGYLDASVLEPHAFVLELFLV
jgi:SAM-dependent methyltransferase